jgi:hypothetical protein
MLSTFGGLNNPKILTKFEIASVRQDARIDGELWVGALTVLGIFYAASAKSCYALKDSG